MSSAIGERHASAIADIRARAAAGKKRRRPGVSTTVRPQSRSIAMVAACPFPSHQGTQVFIRHLANALAGAGHAVQLLTYGEAEELRDVDLEPGVTWHRAPTPAVGLRSGPSGARVVADGVLLASTLKLLKERYVEVLHVHNAEGLAVGVAASRLTGVPLVYHAHSRLASELPLYTGSAVGRWAARLGGAAFDHLLPRSAKAVICFDASQAERMHRAGVLAERIHVVPLGLAMDELDLAGGASPASSRSDKRIVYAGNPDAYQNLDLLRAAFARVRSAVPKATLRLVSNHPAAAFGPLARDTGVEHRPFAGPAELGALLRGAAVGVVTRTLDVGAPVKALTYMSAGLPVVACETGTGGLLRAYPGACRLTASSPEAVADALVSMLGRTRKAGVDEARRALDIRGQIAAYEAVYEFSTRP